MRLAVLFIGPEVEPVLVLPQVVRCVDIPQKGHFASVFLGPGREFRDFFRQEVLMAHGRHRHGSPAVWFEPLADALRIISCCVHDLVAADVALVGVHNPLTTIPADTCRRAKAFDPRAHIARTFCKRLRELRWVDITIVRIPKSAGKVVRLDERVAIFDIFDFHHLDVEALITPHGPCSLELHHALLAVRQTDGACDVVIHRVVYFGFKARIQPKAVALHVHHGPRRTEGRTVARRMPGGAGGQLVLLQQDAVRPAFLGQVIQR